jgi:hypothetical protein
MTRTFLVALSGLFVGLLLGFVLGRSGQEMPEELALWVEPIVPDASGLDAWQREVAAKLELRASFVRGTELGSLRRMLGGSSPSTARLERQIYLVACLQPRSNTGPRVLGLVLEVVHPEWLAGKPVRLHGGLLQDDCLYHVELMIDPDGVLPGDAGEIVRSRPVLRIVSMHAQ